MADRFEDLRTFVTVVQAGGFNAGAERLGLVKSGVSRRIRDLEDRLGSRLINRSTRKISLTDAGRDLYERSVRLLADLAEAEDLAGTGSNRVSGLLRISAPVSFAVHCLAPVIGAFMAIHPGLRVDVDTDDRLVDIVNEGVDLAIRISRLKDSALIARRITTIRHVCVASPAFLAVHGTPSLPADLIGMPGIAYGNVDARRNWTFAGDEVVDVDCPLTLGNGDAIREAAMAGAGIAMLPTFICHEAIRRGELDAVLTRHMRPPMGMHAIHASSRNVPAKIRLFIDFLVERFGDLPFWDEGIFAPSSPGEPVRP